MGKGSILEGHYAELTNKLVHYRNEYISLMEQFEYAPDLASDKLASINTQLELTKAEVLVVWEQLKEEISCKNKHKKFRVQLLDN